LSHNNVNKILRSNEEKINLKNLLKIRGA